MASMTKCEDATLQMWTGTHNFAAAGHTLKAAVHSDALVAETDDELADLTQQSNGNGYTTGGEDIQNDISESSGVTTLTGVDVTWTATGAWSAMRYVTIYNDSSTGDKLIGTYDYGANFTLQTDETFTLDFGASVGTLT